jgi:hypothetical protein
MFRVSFTEIGVASGEGDGYPRITAAGSADRSKANWPSPSAGRPGPGPVEFKDNFDGDGSRIRLLKQIKATVENLKNRG